MIIVPAWCTEYTKIPFQEKGRSRDGVDCWGLVRLVLDKQYGIVDIPDYSDQYSATTDKQSVSMAFTEGVRVGWRAIENPEEAAVVILKQAGRPWHCGIVIDDKTFMHALAGAGVVLERLDSMVWRNRVEGFYRYAR